MRGALYHFFGEANQSQASLINWINEKFNPPIPQINGGMCYMLAMQFLLDYLGEPKHMLPEEIFDRLTADYAYLRQIAGNFRAYIDSAGQRNPIEDTKNYIALMSRKRFEADLVAKFSTRSIPQPLIDNPLVGHLVIIYFKDGAHAVAVVRDQDTYCLYDPNFGIFRTKNADDIYAGVLPLIYSSNYLSGYLLSVAKRKLD